MWANRSDEELLGALTREPGAFSAFYRRHVDDVLGFLARRCRDPEQAADLTAEVFATVLLQARRYRPERGTPAAWLFAIAAHKHNDAWRRAAAEDRARRRLGVRDVPLGAEDLAYIAARAADVEALMADLPDEQRSAVRGRVLEDRGYDELARTAGVSPAAIRQRVSRGLALLRTKVEREAP
jgi:RNA polymerase sigma factor (sigma-70 family)